MNPNAETVLKSIQQTISKATAPKEVVLKQEQIDQLTQQIDEIMKADEPDMAKLAQLKAQVQGFVSGNATKSMTADQFKEYVEGEVAKGVSESDSERIEALQANVGAFIEAAKVDDFSTFEVKVFEVAQPENTVKVDGAGLLSKLDEVIEAAKAKKPPFPGAKPFGAPAAGAPPEPPAKADDSKKTDGEPAKAGDPAKPAAAKDGEPAKKDDATPAAAASGDATPPADPPADGGDPAPVDKGDDEWPMDMNEGRVQTDVEKWGVAKKAAGDDYDFGKDPDYAAAE